ncbi:prepilin-type N-terminal cleavage/methylation domain-containing protein [bacterium]|nr:prepilin-type N-terminal cleavage/methylation domain-containing protein [bacterium]
MKNSDGFTLIEVVMVVVFVGIALVATLEMTSNSVAGSFKIETLNTAANLANAKMELIFADKKSKGYSYIKEQNYPDETNPDGHAGFGRSVIIVDNGTNKEVTVKVSHTDIEDCNLVAYLTNY